LARGVWSLGAWSQQGSGEKVDQTPGKRGGAEGKHRGCMGTLQERRSALKRLSLNYSERGHRSNSAAWPANGGESISSESNKSQKATKPLEKKKGKISRTGFGVKFLHGGGQEAKV